MLTLADLGVLRDVDVVGDSHVVVDITPTYSGCPAMATMRDDLVRELQGAGFDRVEVRVEPRPGLDDRLDHPARPRRARRRRHLAARPGALDHRPDPADAAADRAGRSAARSATRPPTELVSEFGSTACKALYRCTSCLEPFDHVKEI